MLQMPVTTVWGFACLLLQYHPSPLLLTPLPLLYFSSQFKLYGQRSRGDWKKENKFSREKHCMEFRRLCEKKNCFLLISQHVFVVTFLFFPLRHISERFRSLFCSMQIHSKLISIVNIMFLLGQTNFLLQRVIRKRQYVLERLLIYTGFVNGTDLRYNCSICFFEPDCLWGGLGVVKSQGPPLVIYCKHANYITVIVSRNYSCNRLFPLIAFICIKILFTIKQNTVILKIVKYVLSLANLGALGFSAINVKVYVYWLCFLEVSALVPEIKSPSVNGQNSSCYRKQEGNISSFGFAF